MGLWRPVNEDTALDLGGVGVAATDMVPDVVTVWAVQALRKKPLILAALVRKKQQALTNLPQ